MTQKMCNMFRCVHVLFVLQLVATTVPGGMKLPSYFKKCHFYSPNFERCFGLAATHVIPKLVQGNADFDLPPLTPFRFPDVTSPHGSYFRFKLTNAIAGNLQDIQYLRATFDRYTFESNGTAFLHQFYIQGDYEISGKIDGLPVNGRGVANIVFYDLACNMYWNLTRIRRHGVDYIRTLDLQIQYYLEGANYYLSGLHDADRATKHLNRNWKTLARIIAPSAIAAFRDISLYISRSFVARVPLQEIFIF